MRSISNRLTRALVIFALSAASGFAYAADSNVCAGAESDWATSSYQTETMTTKDGVCLRSFAWKAAQVPANGVVVIVHGLRDHALRYEAFAKELSQHGFAVYAQDLRGHAHSGGDRQRFDSTAELVEDVDLVVAKARQAYPGVPVFLYGHSLGGLITTEYALEHGDKLQGIVLSAPALKRPHSVSGFEVVLARAVAAVAPGAHVVAVDDQAFSRDPVVIASLASDPMVSHEKLPAISAVATIDGMQDVQSKMDKLQIPLLILHGTADKVNPIEGSETLSTGASSRDKALKVYEGAYHDLLHEPESKQITADVIVWLTTRRVMREVN